MAGVTNVRVKDFGPIAEASVDLKPLTVFMGPNNSGKSYLALAVYCLSRVLSGDPQLGRIRVGPRGLARRNFISRDLTQRARTEIETAWPNARAFPRGPISVGDLPEGLQSVLLEASQLFANSLSTDLGMELERCYGTEIGNLVRRGGEALSTVKLEIGMSHPDGGFRWDMRATNGNMVIEEWDANLLERFIDVGRDSFGLRELLEDPEYFLMRATTELNLLPPRQLIRRARYMPASRSGILLGHKTLAGLIVGQVSRAWVEPIEIPRLPGVITDLIQAVLLWERVRAPSKELERIISFLEGNVTKGMVEMETESEYPEIHYQNESGEFLLHQVSSMVSEMAPVILYLKHLVREGHLFIIEEPESHLDAENQMRVARAIAMLVNAGVHVVITTHSDFFVNQLNNLLLVSQLSPRRRAARKYLASQVLQPDNVGAYLFEPGTEGSVVHTLGVTADGGIPIEPFSDAHSYLYDEAIALEHTAR